MQLFALPQLMPFTPEFNVGAIVSVTLIFLVSATETIGDTSALDHGGPEPRRPRAASCPAPSPATAS